VYFYDPSRNTASNIRVPISGAVKFNNPVIRFAQISTTLGVNRPFAIIMDELDRRVYCAFKNALTTQLYVSNREIVFVDLTARTVSGLNLGTIVDMDMVLDIVVKSNRLFVIGYK